LNLKTQKLLLFLFLFLLTGFFNKSFADTIPATTDSVKVQKSLFDDFYYIKVCSLIEELKYEEAVNIVMNNDIMKTIKDESALMIYISVVDLFHRGHLSSKDCSSLIEKSRNIIRKLKDRGYFDLMTAQLMSFGLDMFEYNLHRDYSAKNELIEKAENLIRNVDPDKRNVQVVDYLI